MSTMGGAILVHLASYSSDVRITNHNVLHYFVSRYIIAADGFTYCCRAEK